MRAEAPLEELHGFAAEGSTRLTMGAHEAVGELEVRRRTVLQRLLG
jgi:hypothetical protein